MDADKRRPFEWARANPIGSLLQFRRYPEVLGLIAALVLLYLAGSATQSVWTFYSMLKFNWDEQMVGYSLAAIGLGVAIVQGGLVRVVIPKIGPARAILVGFLLYVVGFILFAFATRGWMMFVFLVPYCLGGLSGPALQGLISAQVPPDEQGELQGGLTSLISATGVVGPLLMTNLFAFFTGHDAPIQLPGAPFLLGAVLVLLATVFAFNSLRKGNKSVPGADSTVVTAH